MPPARPTMATSLPHLEIMITDDGSRTLKDLHLDETYHSGCGALSECLHVYLRNSGVEAKLAERPARPVRVLELGFGTGMGWLLTAVAAQALGGHLEYVSLEHQMLPVDILRQVDSAAAIEQAITYGRLPDSYTAASSFQDRLLDVLPLIPSGQHRLFCFSDHNLLSLYLGDARSLMSVIDGDSYDAIYFDAFSPATNPELWQESMFKKMSGMLKPDGLLVSYCVSGAVRRTLERAGFQVSRLPGPPGGKREVLVAKI